MRGKLIEKFMEYFNAAKKIAFPGGHNGTGYFNALAEINVGYDVCATVDESGRRIIIIPFKNSPEGASKNFVLFERYSNYSGTFVSNSHPELYYTAIKDFAIVDILLQGCNSLEKLVMIWLESHKSSITKGSSKYCYQVDGVDQLKLLCSHCGIEIPAKTNDALDNIVFHTFFDSDLDSPELAHDICTK
jgi:hypothetical protein